ncbi:hypothetical protein Q428_05690 [Fervidicella metallireducens AeB]|uniref:PrcB C-terminal domain-containing protein n=1 Tax=Fervidicella metallireducens AeB TaxID=1403537 RepID=A0A017RWB6_9CLOT|nr:protease complex subunit PrcB family protein [Fervidicella metallireducens]EYE88901.1 hypothetical protein Q428_05690 [Fervidicella metallireducens AeB]
MKNKKIFTTFLCLLTSTVSLTAFAQTNYKSLETIKQINPIICNKIDFEIINQESLPSQLKDSLNQCKQKKGFKFYENPSDGYIYISIFAGEKPTGGYGIKVLQVEDNEGKTNVLVREISPSPNDIVTQALTYPYVNIRAKSITPNIYVKNELGFEYPLLSCGETDNNTKPPVTVPNSKNDNNKNSTTKQNLLTLSGKFFKIEYKNGFYFISIKESNNKIKVFYIGKKSPLINNLKKIKPGTNVIIVYSNKNQIKYNKTTSMLLISCKVNSKNGNGAE